ncbi:MAG: hypothetical protein NT145_03625 [Elusimicrobia bacterium]|nr:hypothetical protein [Elusimicrobiota bacterium]
MSKQSPILASSMDTLTEEEMTKAIDNFSEIVGKITRGHLENLIVLNLILKELPKLKKGKVGIKFDFGTKKEWELRRIK